MVCEEQFSLLPCVEGRFRGLLFYDWNCFVHHNVRILWECGGGVIGGFSRTLISGVGLGDICLLERG